MKRTKQVFHIEGDEVPKYVSGCRQFDGEDVCKYSLLPFIISLSYYYHGLLIAWCSLCGKNEVEC
jgi:hypothetical protein